MVNNRKVQECNGRHNLKITVAVVYLWGKLLLVYFNYLEMNSFTASAFSRPPW